MLNTSKAAPPKLHTRITGSRLQKIRAEFFRKRPLCVACQAKGLVEPATQLDHIVPLFMGGEDAPHNRQGLCVACHEVKSAGEVRGGSLGLGVR